MSQTAPVYQVSDLVNEMRRLMEASYPEIWIEGELSSLSKPASGHLYFTLKDQQSQLKCAMFRNRAGINRYQAKAGDLVRVRAKISVYTARGDLQCIVQYIEEAGEGVLQRRFEELKHTLNQQGLFDASHKQTLPSFPRRIGLITSPTGAAVNDILSTLKRRCPSIPVTIYPAVVQGEGAAKSLVNAINDAVQHNHCDVIIIGRGGGSLEDLWCFNDETLAQAIYQCPIPIVSAVGHEVDITIADYVADLRAPTPTAAAELLSPDKQQLNANIASLGQRLKQSQFRYLEKQAQRVDFSYQQLQHPKTSLKNKQQHLANANKRLTLAMQTRLKVSSNKLKQSYIRFHSQPPKRRLQQSLDKLQISSKQLLRAQQQNLKNSQQQFQALGKQLHTISPLATLERGFSIARDKNKVILRDSQDTQTGDALEIQLKSGKLLCEIKQIL